MYFVSMLGEGVRDRLIHTVAEHCDGIGVRKKRVQEGILLVAQPIAGLFALEVKTVEGNHFWHV